MDKIFTDGIEVFCAHDQLVEIEKVVGNPKNPNQHPEDQINLLAKIIKAQGWRTPISISSRSGFVVRGHGRLAAARKLGLNFVPVDYQEYESEAAEYADLIADNRIAELSNISEEAVAELLKDIRIDDINFDLEITGFSLAEISNLLDDIVIQEDDDFDIDEEVESISDPITKHGDIWLLGKHRLICGDSTNRDDIVRLMDGKSANLIFTDPPYNVDYGASKNPRHKIRKIENDNMNTEDWKSFCSSLFQNFKDFCIGDIYMWGASGPEGMRMRLWLIDTGCHWSATIVWKKNQLVLSPAKYQRMYEPCFYGWFGKSSFVADRKKTEVWEFDRPRDSKLHPTMKPIALCSYGIENSSRPGDLVLDFFGGSGSTLIACEQVNRVCYMCEIDPVYCDVIIKRYEKMTGDKAVLEDLTNA